MGSTDRPITWSWIHPHSPLHQRFAVTVQVIDGKHSSAEQQLPSGSRLFSFLSSSKISRDVFPRWPVMVECSFLGQLLGQGQVGWGREGGRKTTLYLLSSLASGCPCGFHYSYYFLPRGYKFLTALTEFSKKGFTFYFILLNGLFRVTHCKALPPTAENTEFDSWVRKIWRRMYSHSVFFWNPGQRSWQAQVHGSVKFGQAEQLAQHAYWEQLVNRSTHWHHVHGLFLESQSTCHGDCDTHWENEKICLLAIFNQRHLINILASEMKKETSKPCYPHQPLWCHLHSFINCFIKLIKSKIHTTIPLPPSCPGIWTRKVPLK